MDKELNFDTPDYRRLAVAWEDAFVCNDCGESPCACFAEEDER